MATSNFIKEIISIFKQSSFKPDYSEFGIRDITLDPESLEAEDVSPKQLIDIMLLFPDLELLISKLCDTNLHYLTWMVIIANIESGINKKITTNLPQYALEQENEKTCLSNLLQVLSETRLYSTPRTFVEICSTILPHFNTTLRKLFIAKSKQLFISETFFDFVYHAARTRFRGKGFQDANKRIKLYFSDCSLCYADNLVVLERDCCSTKMCIPCLQAWTQTLVFRRQLQVPCPNCPSLFDKEEIVVLMSDKSYRFHEILTDLNLGNKNEKTCPNCLLITKKPASQSRFKKKVQTFVECERCSFRWCFKCHSPAHADISCRKNKNQDHLLREWSQQLTKSRRSETEKVRKARRCPNMFCRVLIEKNDGCNHMICTSCGRQFCYLCKKRWRLGDKFLIFGNHSSKYSIFGCKSHFYPDRPAARIFIRGSLFILELIGLTLSAPVILTLLATTLGLVVGFLPVVLPIVLVVKVRKSHRRAAQREAQFPVPLPYDMI